MRFDHGTAPPRAGDAGHHVLLRDGGMAYVRPLRPTDRTALRELVSRLSERSTYLRFFTTGTRTARDHVDRITRPDWTGRGLLAFIGDRVAGAAEFTPLDTGAAAPGATTATTGAEIGLMVADWAHGRGLGTLLLEQLAIMAAGDGMTEFTATALPENRSMIEVFRDAGFPVEQRREGDVVHFRVPLHQTRDLLAAIAAREHTAEVASLTRLLRPASVAVIGAGRSPDNIGRAVLRNLIEGGFPGPVHPVNPHASRIAGLPAYPSVMAVPAEVGLAVIATPAPTVPAIARECAERGVGAVVVISAGFAETGPEGARREAELLDICRSAGMRLVGPNCLGIVNTSPQVSLNASFLPRMPAPGRLAIMSQSGAVGVALIESAAAAGMGVSSFVSAGNKADVSSNDLLQFWEDDDDTAVIALYLESFGNPRKFGVIARRVSARKPIVVLKSGHSPAGTRAVRSHTAAAATSDAAVDALLHRAGAIRVKTVRELVDASRLLAHQRAPRGRAVAIVGNSGGPGVLAADACAAAGLRVPELGAPTQRALRDVLGPTATVDNPVDITAEGDARKLTAAITAALGDPGVDSVIAVYTPPFGSGPELSRAAIAAAARRSDKPVLACVIGMDGVIDPPEESANPPTEDAGPEEDAGIGRDAVPSYAYPEQAVTALRHAVDYAERRAGRPEAPAPRRPYGLHTPTVRTIVESRLAREPEGAWLDPPTGQRLLRAYGIHVAETVPVDGAETAAEAASAVGFPAVLKATGPGLVHKTEAGAVRLGLESPAEVRAAYRELSQALGPAMTGAIVQHMSGPGTEIIVGAVQDPTFGPLLMVGMGGIATRLFGDQAFRVPPLEEGEAGEMLRSLRCAPLLFGFRGRPPADVATLEDQVNRVGWLAADHPEIAELDLNPVIATPAGAGAVDHRIRLAPPAPVPSPLHRGLD